MRRADRLFELIQLLRSGGRARTAADLASALEVSVRTVYRDIAVLQARRVPIEGEPGIGYLLRSGFDLPALMFTPEEVEAIAVGMRLVRRTGDAGLHAAADRVLSKVATALPEPLRDQLALAPFHVSATGAEAPENVSLTEIRAAIRAQRKIRIIYATADGARSERTIWPVGIAYYVLVTLVGAWCETRQDYRHFRVDRILSVDMLDETYPADRGRLAADWLRLPRDAPRVVADMDGEPRRSKTATARRPWSGARSTRGAGRA